MTKKYQEYVDIGLRARKLSIPQKELSTIINVIELVQKKGGKVTLKDVCKIKIEHIDEKV
jgi:hypothetical protein